MCCIKSCGRLVFIEIGTMWFVPIFLYDYFLCLVVDLYNVYAFWKVVYIYCVVCCFFINDLSAGVVDCDFTAFF